MYLNLSQNTKENVKKYPDMRQQVSHIFYRFFY